MNRKNTVKGSSRALYGPTVQYSDGKIVPGKPVDVAKVLAAFEELDADARSAFLCIIAHDLTVGTRSIVFDPPVTDAGLGCVKWINEALHQLTSCVNPQNRWSAADEVLLIQGIIDNSFQYGFDQWMGRAIAAAAGNTIKPITAEQRRGIY
jgi:hypothetical protein